METAAEAIDKIAKMAVAGMPVVMLDQFTAVFRDDHGNPKKVEIAGKPFTTIHYSVPSLVADTIIKEDFWEILYSRRGIRGFQSSRRNCMTMRLTKSPAFEQLAAWDAKPDPVKQDAFVHMLKTKFRRCCDDAVEKIVSTLKWTVGNSGESTVKHAGVSMNKNIVAEMTGVDDLNKIEYITFTVPIFLEIPLVTAKIECHLKPIPDNQLFVVTPCGGEIENAYREAESAIEKAIKAAIPAGYESDGYLPVFHGYADADNVDAPKL